MSITIVPPPPTPSTPPSSATLKPTKFEVWYKDPTNPDGAMPYGMEYDRETALELSAALAKTYRCPAWILPARKRVRQFRD